MYLLLSIVNTIQYNKIQLLFIEHQHIVNSRYQSAPLLLPSDLFQATYQKQKVQLMTE